MGRFTPKRVGALLFDLARSLLDLNFIVLTVAIKCYRSECRKQTVHASSRNLIPAPGQMWLLMPSNGNECCVWAYNDSSFMGNWISLRASSLYFSFSYGFFLAFFNISNCLYSESDFMEIKKALPPSAASVNCWFKPDDWRSDGNAMAWRWTVMLLNARRQQQLQGRLGSCRREASVCARARLSLLQSRACTRLSRDSPWCRPDSPDCGFN